jgi:alkylation response protein AidB-like acyl-CoA dehydrogenase
MTLDRTRRSPGLEELRARFAPVLATIAAGALERELDRRLPVDEVELLKQSGFGAVRVPREHGGAGASLADLTQLWIDLAAADNNLAQVLRGHFAFAEDRLWHHAREGGQEVWFDRFVRGQIAGNAWSEVGATAIDTQGTVLRPAGDGQFRLDGTKYYTTGTIFAEWADVYVRRGDEVGGFAIAVVDTDQAGVSVHDDWNGFGQVGTGSGTAVFVDARVAASDVLAFEERFPYQTALYQLNLLATLAGIGRAALGDVVRHVRGRERTYSHANAPRVRDDAQVLARVGEIASAVYAAEAVTLRVADALDAAHGAATLGAAEAASRAEAAELESSAAQVVVTDLVLRATSDLFDALGASGTAQDKGLDRHWRNARTVASHNPRILKARVVGDAEVNGTPPPYAWAIGRTERDRTDWRPRAVPVPEVVG